MTTSIVATVLDIYYPKEIPIVGTRNFYILKTTLGCAKGATYLTPRIGQAYEFVGNYSVFQGRQEFKFDRMIAQIPVEPLALLKYACEVTHGCGEATATKIWATYGSDYYKVLSNKEKKTQKECALLETLNQLDKNNMNAKAIAYLMDKGATYHLAEQAATKFGSDIIPLFNENPYVLADIPRQSFKTIDTTFRERCNISLTSPIRVKALLFYTLNQLAESSGHTLLKFDEVMETLALHNIDVDSVRNIITEANGFVILQNGCITTKQMFATEKIIYDFLRGSSNSHSFHSSLDDSHEGLILDDSQIAAVQNAINTVGLSVINGGAGCGKTTIIKCICEKLESMGETVRLVAFAGKAAARVREATKHPASTIHSLLGYVPERGFSAGNFDDVNIVVDESSMVPSYLMAELCKRSPRRLILVGDEAQLPPVGAGAPFHDIVRTGISSTVTTCYRNKEAIYQAAYAVRNGGYPANGKSEKETFAIYHVKDASEAHSLVDKFIDHLDFDRDVIICPRNGEESEMPATVNSINALALTKLGLNKGDDDTRIICLTNDPKLKVWNGSTGKILRTDVDGNVYATVDDAQVYLPRRYMLASTSPAYALTIHKSQGSQYRRVVIVALFRDTVTLFDRAMLYTAITRAKEGCVVITDTNLFNIINKNESRSTVLKELLA